MSDGQGPHDSRRLHVGFLFSELKTGFAFVRSAQLLTDPEVRLRTLGFAQRTHDSIVAALCDAPLTEDERIRLDAELVKLRTAIADSLP